MQGILIVMYRYHHEQAIHVRAPDQRGVRARVVGDELNALGCIWLKTDSIAHKILAW